MEEQELKHFSHELHPLTLMEISQQKNEINVQKSNCYGCTNPISLDPTYTCEKCDIFLHKICAQLPREINHPMHTDHLLILLAKPPYTSGSCECEGCTKSWRNFIYHCSSCQFNIDILCAFTERKFEHSSHTHPLTLVQRPASFKCNACNETNTQESYLCTICPFWIHKSCGLLPRIYQRDDHDHPLSLAYCLPNEYRGYGFSCELCHRELKPSSWVYYCGHCRYFVHISCITKQALKPDVDRKPDYFPFPNNNLVEIIQHYSGVVKNKLGKSDQEFSEIKIESHKHTLVLSQVQKDLNNTKQEDMIICDGCIEPITIASSSYYKCGQHCNFFLHAPCAQLPIELPIFPSHLTFKTDGPHNKLKLIFPDQNSWDVVKCNACGSNCTGYSYKCEKGDFFVDVKCGCLRGTIQHKSHKHPLKQVDFWHLQPWGSKCNGCGVYNHFDPFVCGECHYYLGLECVTLPASVKHRWDKHELILSFPPYIDVHDKFYCEICEEEIHPKHWTYRCMECDRSFHPRCIPTLGTSRNIKFGRTLEISCHPHPLTLVPDGKFHFCDSCHKFLAWQKVRIGGPKLLASLMASDEAIAHSISGRLLGARTVLHSILASACLVKVRQLCQKLFAYLVEHTPILGH
ncbi:hypothetical protein ACH5RR_007342 [Cinchona calisaya]|uniref:Phorbol-ester/DAG-type domain-containing protein n=1 Tax=Cinchona calisaya TaxID=153742 RepID=A0ABD3ARJ3_9GENT